MSASAARRRNVSSTDVALFVPNLIGYGRLALTALGIYLHLSGQYELFVGVYWFSSFLDLIDGYAARKLGQMSRFGEVLDVVVDNIGRAFLWSYVAGSQPGHVAAPLAVGVTVLEFLTFASTHASSILARTNWKSRNQASPNFLLRWMFANNFRNPIGISAIFGTFYYPLHLYGRLYTPELYATITFNDSRLEQVIAVWLVAGRLLAFVAEVHLIGQYASALLEQDAETHSSKASSEPGGADIASPAAPVVDSANSGNVPRTRRRRSSVPTQAQRED